MPKVVITGKKTRTMAQDHKSVAPIHKPASKPGPGKAYQKAPTVAQDKKYNEIQM
jgi:hypothetical protein